MDGSLLALGTAAALAAAGVAAGRSGSLAAVAELRAALREAPRGSINVATGRALDVMAHLRQRKRFVTGAAPKYARLFLTMEPGDVPDDLLVATLLAGSTAGDPVETAAELLEAVRGNLGRVIDALPEGIEDDLTAVGRARLTAASELARRAEYRGAARQIVQLTSPDKVVRLLKSISRGPYEILSAIYLDRRRNVIGTRLLSKGTSGFTIVDPMQVFRPAVQLGASAVILAHQHPSGDPTPSQQDYDITRRVAQAGRVLGVPLLDHLVISATSPAHVSMAEEGRIPAATGGQAAIYTRA